MTTFFYAICNAFCALPAGCQVLMALGCVLISAGIIYLMLLTLRVALYRLQERMGVCLDADYEPYEDWMDADAYE